MDMDCSCHPKASLNIPFTINGINKEIKGRGYLSTGNLENYEIPAEKRLFWRKLLSSKRCLYCDGLAVRKKCRYGMMKTDGNV